MAIDYTRMAEVWPKQKADLEEAVARNDAQEVTRLCK